MLRGSRLKDVIVGIGPGQIGPACARRVDVGRHVLLADVREESAQGAADVMASAGYDVSTALVDVSSPKHDPSGDHQTPLARDECRWPRVAGYPGMIEVAATGRAGTPDEVATVAVLSMGPDGGFITASGFLMDGGVTAAYWYGEFPPP